MDHQKNMRTCNISVQVAASKAQGLTIRLDDNARNLYVKLIVHRAEGMLPYLESARAEFKPPTSQYLVNIIWKTPQFAASPAIEQLLREMFNAVIAAPQPMRQYSLFERPMTVPTSPAPIRTHRFIDDTPTYIYEYADKIRQHAAEHGAAPNFANINTSRQRNAVWNYIKSALARPTMSMDEALSVASLI